jgi:hypothetical protein
MDKKPIQQKKLHLVWFLDSAKTHTFAISLKTLQALAITAVTAIITFGLTIALAFKQATFAHTQNEYIKELKAALVAQVMTQSEPGAEPASTQPTPPVPQSAPVAPKENAVRATDEAPADNKQPQTSISEKAVANSGLGVRASGQNGVGLEFFSLKTADSGDATINITLSAGSELMGRTIAGYVCAVILHKNGKRSAAPRFANLEPQQTCAKGVAVRFSRLRPTEIETNLPASQIQSVELRFQDADGSALVTKTFLPN